MRPILFTLLGLEGSLLSVIVRPTGNRRRILEMPSRPLAARPIIAVPTPIPIDRTMNEGCRRVSHHAPSPAPSANKCSPGIPGRASSNRLSCCKEFSCFMFVQLLMEVMFACANKGQMGVCKCPTTTICWQANEFDLLISDLWF